LNFRLLPKESNEKDVHIIQESSSLRTCADVPNL
jgi:hypothetical protein